MLAFNGKRRNSDLENDDQNIDENDMDTSSFKRVRLDAPTFTEHSLVNNHDSFTAQYFQDAQYNAYRAEREQELAQLDTEIQRVSQECEELSRQCEEATQENKVLKKGIQIQESKLKEASHHQDQLTQMIQHAITHINGLEKANQELFAEIELYRNGKKRPDDIDDTFHDCSRF